MHFRARTRAAAAYARLMARPPRLEVAHGIYHVLSRGAVRQAVYRDSEDRLGFLSILGRSVARHGWLCHAYCLMTTHYHLLVQIPASNLAVGMHAVNGLYAQRFNRRHDATGHVFGARYTSILVETQSHFVELSRYLALNPVRAGTCADPAEWPWSSYRATAGFESGPSWLSLGVMLGAFSEDEQAAREHYRRFVRDGMDGRDTSRGQAPGRVPSGQMAGA